MISTAASKQNELLSVINDLFIFVPDPYTKKNKIRINPKLTDELLQQNIVKTRKIIVELYIKCETDYVNGLKIYEAIVEKKILETTQKQINTLKKESDNIVSETKNIIKPPIETLPPIKNLHEINMCSENLMRVEIEKIYYLFQRYQMVQNSRICSAESRIETPLDVILQMARRFEHRGNNRFGRPTRQKHGRFSQG
jgi:hypothetical protein